MSKNPKNIPSDRTCNGYKASYEPLTISLTINGWAKLTRRYSSAIMGAISHRINAQTDADLADDIIDRLLADIEVQRDALRRQIVLDTNKKVQR